MLMSCHQCAATCWTVAAALIVAAHSGCGGSGPGRISLPSVNPKTAAAGAIRLYDSNGDGRLDDSELVACPAIRSARNRYDQDGDGQVSQEEIAARLETLFSSGVGAQAVMCTVTQKGRPLAGAEVRLVPEEFLGNAVPAATGTTDDTGVAQLGMRTDLLPANLRNLPMMQPGIYRVEITHPALSAANQKPLGFEVDPSRRDGTTARFDL